MAELSTLSFGNTKYMDTVFSRAVANVSEPAHAYGNILAPGKVTHTLMASEGLHNQEAKTETLHECNQEHLHPWSQGNKQHKICQEHDKERVC